MRESTLFRYNEDPTWHDLENWPQPIVDDWSESDIQVYNERCKAIRQWFDDVPLARIEAETGILRREFYNFLQRALSYRSPEDIWGFVALTPRIHIKPYSRTSSSSAGTAGLWTQFCDKYPELVEALESDYLRKPIPRSTRERLKTLKSILKAFRKKARKFGISGADYPFNNADGGLECVRSHCVQEPYKSGQRRAVVHARQGESAAKIHDATAVQSPDRLKFREVPYDRVQFDEHLLNFFMTVSSWGPEGLYRPLVLTRCWLLVLIDVVSRAVLGYHLSLNPRYNRFDVLRCIANALDTWHPRELTIPGMQYALGAGLPSGVVTGCKGRLFTHLSLDNCSTHIPKTSRGKISHVAECAVQFNKGGHPIENGFVERFYGSLSTALSDRLPSTTGRFITDFRRREAEHAAEEYDINVEEIEEVLDVVIADYNADQTHYALKGISPNRTIEEFDRQCGIIPRHLHPFTESHNPLRCRRMPVTVRCSRQGGQPYVRWKHADYRSTDLSRLALQPGKSLKMMADVAEDDARFMHLFEADGSYLGVLAAQGEWGDIRHDVKMREVVCKLIQSRKLKVNPNKSAAETYLDYVATEAPHDRAARRELARQQRNLQDEFPPVSLYTEEDMPDDSTLPASFERLSYDRIIQE